MNLQKIKNQNIKIPQCTLCPRLIEHCKNISEKKRKAFINEKYWGKPVPSFGDPKAKLFILGLAPAAHGANRTGRMFTGDRSGEWLYRALYKAGFSNQMESVHSTDSLKLKNAYITATAHCAPPQNKPTPEEIKNCLPYLENEIKWIPIKVYLVLGQIALNSLWKTLSPNQKKPKFKHLGEHRLPDGRVILMSYHPSQQNTFTKRLTEPMFDEVFHRANQLIQS
ncbi:MAG: uracil-DNA glycosylase [Bdellovibrionaceae bacterium]|nr:uracil-DNA glycosylase [Pseudobdellovibrionaceae bacterium]|tara:strand:+ start:2944 stop:3615 length:672 start_codon:yes stop_codon:yes gene_type:complete